MQFDEHEYDFKTFVFGHGDHDTREQGMCLMEAVSYLAGEPHSDRPQCTSPVLTAIAIELNDSYADTSEDNAARQQALADLPWRLIGTRADEAVEFERLRRLRDWLWPRARVVLKYYESPAIAVQSRFGVIFDQLVTPGGDATRAVQAAEFLRSRSYHQAVQLLGAQALTTLSSLHAVDHLDARASCLLLSWYHYMCRTEIGSQRERRAEQRKLRDLLLELIQMTEPQEQACRSQAVSCG